MKISKLNIGQKFKVPKDNLITTVDAFPKTIKNSIIKDKTFEIIKKNSTTVLIKDVNSSTQYLVKFTSNGNHWRSENKDIDVILEESILPKKKIMKIKLSEAIRLIESKTGKKVLLKEDSYPIVLTSDNFFEEIADINADLGGPSAESAINSLKEEFDKLIKKEFKGDTSLEKVAKNAIKELWVSRIKSWK